MEPDYGRGAVAMDGLMARTHGRTNVRFGGCGFRLQVASPAAAWVGLGNLARDENRERRW
jgi:hypothetical protein